MNERVAGDLYVISGATGMTGNELVRQLAKNGQEVIGFDNFFCVILAYSPGCYRQFIKAAVHIL